jgi:hypothetical protein
MFIAMSAKCQERTLRALTQTHFRRQTLVLILVNARGAMRMAICRLS